MDAYTYSNARQHLSEILNKALKQGQVKITRRDGASFVIRPELKKRSPLNIKGVRVKGLSLGDILESVKEGRKYY